MLGEVKISIRAYAKQIHVDEKAVRKAIGEGKIKKGFDKKTKKITASIANKEWGFQHFTPKPQRGVSSAKVAEKLQRKDVEKKSNIKSVTPGSSEEIPEILDIDFSYQELISKIKIHPELQYSEAIRRKEILAIANDRMKLEEANGLLLRKDDINKALYAVGDQLKKELLNLPNRITEDIRSAPTKVEAMNIFNLELNQVLTAISNLALP
jgi:hypothetical protein